MHRICFKITSEVGPKPKYNTKPENVSFGYKDEWVSVIAMMDWNHMFGKISKKIVEDWVMDQYPKMIGNILRIILV